MAMMNSVLTGCSTKEVLEYIQAALGKIYSAECPWLTNATGYGTDINLYVLHDVYAYTSGTPFQRHWLEVRESVGATALWFSGHFIESRGGDATEHECTIYVVSQWKRVSAAMGIVVSDEVVDPILLRVHDRLQKLNA